MLKNKPFISMIMPNYNNEHVLDLFFSKLVENNTYDNYELIVTDDGSTDGSLKILKQWQKSGKIKNFTLFAEPHKGIISALNKCLYASKGEFIIRLDGDATIETKGFIENFLEFYNVAPEKIGVITAKVYMDSGKLHTIGRNIMHQCGIHARGIKVFIKGKGKRTLDNISLIEDENLSTYIDLPAECDTALGVCTFSDKETALKLGGFDKHYPLYIEDDDFYLGYRLYGKKVFYLPNIEICHRFSLRGSRERTIDLHKIKTKFLKTIFIFLSLNKIPVLFEIKEAKNKNWLWKRKILKQDYEYWYKKWGFDALNPDLEYIKNRYKGTELVWNFDEKLKQDGIDIVNKYLQQKTL